jgi:hypothetical protein
MHAASRMPVVLRVQLQRHVVPRFTRQVLDEICQILTDKQFMGKMVVVLAGYEAQIEELLSVNPGLKSRFSERLAFPDFSADDAVELLKQQLGSQYSLEMSAEAEEELPGLMQQVRTAGSGCGCAGTDASCMGRQPCTVLMSHCIHVPHWITTAHWQQQHRRIASAVHYVTTRSCEALLDQQTSLTQLRPVCTSSIDCNQPHQIILLLVLVLLQLIDAPGCPMVVMS